MDPGETATNTASPGRIIARSLLLTLVFLLLRLPLLARTSLSGDESVFGLMALAIARGEDYPLYCWGAHYASALISYLAVPVMACLGVTTFAFKATTLPYGVVTTLLLYHALRRSFGDLNAWLTALCFAIPVPTVLNYSVAAHGGYPETYFLGIAFWIATLGILEKPSRSRFFLLGFLGGAIISILWLGVPFLLAGMALLVLRKSIRRKEAWAGLAGGLIGLLPFLAYNLWIAPASTILRLGGHSLGTARRAAVPRAVLERLLGIPDWMAESAGGIGSLFAPIGGFAGALLLLIATLWGAVRLNRARNDWGRLTLWFVAMTTLFNFAGGLTRDRHWSILVFGILIGVNGLPRMISRMILVLIIATSLVGSVAEIAARHPDPTIAAAVERLRLQKAPALIADYDLGYPIAFRSGIIVSTTAPPNAVDRRPDWTARIRLVHRPGVMLPPGETARRFEERLLATHTAFSRYEMGARTLYFPEASGGEIMNWIAEATTLR